MTLLQNIIKDENIFYYLTKAREVSLKSIHHKAKIGAILVGKGKVISRGFNQKRHFKFSNYPYIESLHAEVDCLRKILFRENSKNLTLFIYRETKTGKLALCKPCEYCIFFIKKLKIRRIVYTLNEYPFFKIEYIGKNY